MMYSPFRHLDSILWKRRPIHLTYFVTRRCNSRCPFCFYLQSATDGDHAAEELSADEIGTLSQSLGKLLWLAFSGGEIFLRNDLPEISRIFYRNNRPAIMLYPTNGLLPSLIEQSVGEILHDCRESIITVKLSIDGLHEKHDQIRNTPGAFARVMETYGRLERFAGAFPNFELGINTVFTRDNQDDMDDIIGFVKKMPRVRTHTVSLIRGDLADEGIKSVDTAKYLETIGKLEDNLKTGASPVYRFRGARVKAAQDIMQRGFIHQTMVEKKRLIPCYAGKLNLVLTEAGEVYPCEILKSSLGNIREYGYDFMRLLRSEKAREVLRSIKARECYCTHECYFMTNILFNPRLYPRLAREYAKIGR